ASEVKALAEQTAKATGEISTQISGIQAATQESVGAIKEIGDTIGRMSEIASTIVSAVEEQGAATQEISRNVQQAAQGTHEVSSNIAADSTCEEDEPVSLAPRCTSTMLEETSWVPWAACCTLRELSCVAAPCSSTAAAMAEEISDSFSMVPLISRIAVTESSVADWIPEIW